MQVRCIDGRSEEEEGAAGKHNRAETPSGLASQDDLYDKDGDDEFYGFSDCSSTSKRENGTNRSKGIQGMVASSKTHGLIY